MECGICNLGGIGMKRKSVINTDFVSIYDKISPSLKAGEYTISIQQNVSWDQNDKKMDQVQNFFIDAPDLHCRRTI